MDINKNYGIMYTTTKRRWYHKLFKIKIKYNLYRACYSVDEAINIIKYDINFHNLNAVDVKIVQIID